jgi:hypothetical protein
MSLAMRSSLLRAQQNLALVLSETQEPDGSFPLYKISKSTGNFDDISMVPSLFSTLEVLLRAGSALNPMQLGLAVDYILSQRLDSGLWSWGDDSLRPSWLDEPKIPADLDDTALALACLHLFRPEVCADADADLILRAWRKNWGPFRTWPESEGKYFSARVTDDAVVNANAWFAFGILSGSSPVKMKIGRGYHRLVGMASPYYLNNSARDFAEARAFGRRRPRLDRQRVALQQGVQETAETCYASGKVSGTQLQVLLSLSLETQVGPKLEPWICGDSARVSTTWASPAVSVATVLLTLRECVEGNIHVE